MLEFQGQFLVHLLSIVKNLLFVLDLELLDPDLVVLFHLQDV